MKKFYSAPELEVELFDTVVMALVEGSQNGVPGGILDEEDPFGDL